MRASLTVTTIGVIWGSAAVSQGVPTVDGNLFIRNEAANLRRESDLATQAERLSAAEAISEIEREQLAVLQQILDAQSSFGGQGIPAMVSTLEDGTLPEQSADNLYSPIDGNPGANQMFGDANLNIEQLIIRVAQETHGLTGVSQAGLTVVQWRCLLQALIWQESRFTIGARSPVGAFGLTQIMPGTAGDLGINPEYYDSPYLQVEGGARYLSQMLRMFDGNIIHALAAYNAGPGNVQTYGGVPPFKETQHYVQVIPAKYNFYLTRVGGVDALGTIDSALLANSNLSITGSGASFYANSSMQNVEAAALRIQNTVRRIGQTQDVQESLALNTYARAELVRLVSTLTRLKAVRTRPLSDAELAMAAAQLRENQFMDFTLEELD
ncbi:lytic transglycosylase domain-containing protein [uncultured Sulfitobacter sp.]|uniref:lytic transglycosylase domain-containing protein n=1 Tax=uncultured Sulfitobacter sp. TaxID=191468 RepID=UPI00260ED580|nr:lytic transglycosylase domain-containing protein [uncultured Sulfitobacter sp.]